jgi:aspartyl-tRNA synthetase
MAFVTREDVLNTFEALTRQLFSSILNIDLGVFPRMSYDDAMSRYGSDKPDVRFGMEFIEFNNLAKGHGFSVFDEAELIIGILIPGQAEAYSNKMLNDLTEWMKRPQIGAKGMINIKFSSDGSMKSSIGKYYSDEELKQWGQHADAKPNDMLLILSGEKDRVRKQLNELRLEMGTRLGLRDSKIFKPLWVLDFPLLEWDEDSQRFHAMHHPFTSPKSADIENMLDGDHETMKGLRADAYDLVINGVEIGGGSIRIHDRALQEKNFKLLGFTPEQAESQFGFLLGAFEYGAPPHGGIAFGFDRLCAMMKGETSIRDFIAFPKNNMGRDMMIDAPSVIDDVQLKELSLKILKKE